MQIAIGVSGYRLCFALRFALKKPLFQKERIAGSVERIQKSRFKSASILPWNVKIGTAVARKAVAFNIQILYHDLLENKSLEETSDYRPRDTYLTLGCNG